MGSVLESVRRGVRAQHGGRVLLRWHGEERGNVILCNCYEAIVVDVADSLFLVVACW